MSRKPRRTGSVGQPPPEPERSLDHLKNPERWVYESCWAGPSDLSSAYGELFAVCPVKHINFKVGGPDFSDCAIVRYYKGTHPRAGRARYEINTGTALGLVANPNNWKETTPEQIIAAGWLVD